MKNIVYISVFSFLLCSCGGGGEDNLTPEPLPIVNKAPSTPTQITPSNNQLCIDYMVVFQWNVASDPNGDPVSYVMQVATDNQFTQNLQTKTSSSTTISVTLNKGVAYYWRVQAKDSKGLTSSYSSTFSFYTEGDGESNHLPFSPAIVNPEQNSIEHEAIVTLEWTASDVDSNDTLSFDVFFDTVNPPAIKVAENHSETTLNQTLESSKSYYWKVVVKDDKGGETICQIWCFKTD